MYTSPSFQTVIVLTLALSLVFSMLLFYTFWTRTKKKYWSRYKKKFRNYFFPQLFEFIEEATSPADADNIISNLTRRTNDIDYFLELIDELREVLHGEEQEKLKWLLKHPLFLEFYRKKLNSHSLQGKLFSCIYFEKSDYDDRKIDQRLSVLSKSKNLKLAFAASKALQSSSDIAYRKKSLIRFLTRKDASDLMHGEIIHKFYRDGEKLHAETAGELKKILSLDYIAPQQKRIIVTYFAEQNFYEFGDYLLQCLNQLSFNSENRGFVLELIYAMGTLEVKKAESPIREYLRFHDPELRLACINALNRIGGEHNLDFIHQQIVDIEFSVRKKVIEILVQYPQRGHQLLSMVMRNYLQYAIELNKVHNPTQNQVHILEKIASITKGIRILSGTKKRRSFYTI